MNRKAPTLHQLRLQAVAGMSQDAARLNYKLLDFRVGTFALAVEHQLPIYYTIVLGSHDCWRATERLGGRPATIYVQSFMVTSAPPTEAKADIWKSPATEESLHPTFYKTFSSPREVSTTLHVMMQSSIDSMNKLLAPPSGL
jgi:hypothetical protein